MAVQILTGDARDVLAGLPDGSVHTCITSPPYWGLRSYGGDDGMIGLETTFEAHLENLLAVFREVRRVLRPDGTLWLNYGDAYANDTKWGGSTGGKHAKGLHGQTGIGRQKVQTGLKPKDLMMMPSRVALAMQEDGWWVRSEIIWHKPNPMPESATDRPTTAHEKLFLLTRAKTYFYDAEAVRVPSITGDTRRPYGSQGAWEIDGRPDEKRHGGEQRSGADGTKANLRNVWSITTASFKEAHFATFPPALVEPCIKAGTSERGVCPHCGAPWVRQIERSGGTIGRGWHQHEDDQGAGQTQAVFSGGLAGEARRNPYSVTTTGWMPGCDCAPHEPVPATVLDPFGGAGTVGLVADRLQRNAIIVEINPEYAEMARRRIHGDAPLLGHVTGEQERVS